MKSTLLQKKIGSVLAVVIVIAMMGIACGNGETPAPPPSGQDGNQLPVISSLTPAQTQVYPSGTIEIRCVASDTDGDKLSYEWSSTGGSFTGIGEIITWKAPENYGDYDITVTVEDGNDGTTQASLTLSVTSNQPPQISSLTADPSTVLPKGSSVITCVASDPDGETVRYNWSSDEGSLTGVGDKVTWIAPNKGGTFSITVMVSDGEGGETTGNVVINVASATKTVTLNVVDQETGTVSSEGDKDTSKTMAGDDGNNIGYRTFWSFNIRSLVGTEIEDAKLTFTTRTQANDPFSKTIGLKGLHLWRVNYGQDKLPSFDITGNALEKAAPTMYEPPIEIDITPEIIHLVNAASNRFQVEARFEVIADGDDVAEYIEWSSVTLTVTYSEK